MQTDDAEMIQDHAKAEPSLIALGKRPEVPSSTVDALNGVQAQSTLASTSVDLNRAVNGNSSTSHGQSGPVRNFKARTVEKRVTRSSLGGQTSREGSVLGSEGD